MRFSNQTAHNSWSQLSGSGRKTELLAPTVLLPIPLCFFLAPSVPSAYICSLEYYWTYIWYIALASMHKFTVDTPVIKLQTWHFQMNLCGKIRILHVYFKRKVCYDYWGELVLLKKISTKFIKPTEPELPVRHYRQGLSSGFSSIACY